MDNLVNDVRAGGALLDSPDLVAIERLFQHVVQFELRAFAQLVGGSLLKLARHVLQLLLQLHLRFEALHPLGIDGRDFVPLERFPL